jgi:hypothetical protein
MLGIDEDKRVFYEGPSNVGIAIWPTPFVSIATPIRTEQDLRMIPAQSSMGHASLVFREDQFDPVTRIRRGRFYNRGDGAQPQTWSVQAHPALPSDSRSVGAGGLIKKQVLSFFDYSARANFTDLILVGSVALGIQGAMTLWRVIGIEQISTGEDLVTLKARSNLGVIPQIVEERIPESDRNRVVQCASNLVDTAYRAGPESVIDRCRDLSAAILGSYFEQETPNAAKRDLGDLARIAGGMDRGLIENAARLIARLHSRAKPNEQSRLGVMPPTDEDAALALECTSFIIREVGWQKA